MLTITEFLLARIAEDEEAARLTKQFPSEWEARPDDPGQPIRAGNYRVATGAASVLPHVARHDPARVLAECRAKRAIVELNKSWPVLIETQPTVELDESGLDALNSLTARMAKRIEWLTTQEYRKRFGDEPPAAPMLRHLAAVYSDHPDYREEWKP